MKCRDVNQIEIKNRSIRPRKKFSLERPLNGIDTETEKGKAFIIGYYRTESFNGIKKIDDHADMLNFLLTNQFKSANNFFYNLGYDAQAIFKNLPMRNIEDIALTNQTNVQGINITYIPNKMLKLSNDASSAKFYDIAQFYQKMSLDKASSRFIDCNKIDISKLDIDIKQLSSRRYDSDREYKSKIDAYLLQDAKLTKLLADKIIQLAKPYIQPKHFFSVASFSQQYFMENLKAKLHLPNDNILQFGLNAYQGGRFETYRRGTFDNAFIYDIKSAYPFHNINVPDVGKGKWQRSKSYDNNALVSIFKCDYDFPPMKITPTKYDCSKGPIIYPYGKFKDSYINKNEYETISLFTTIKIKDAWHYYDDEPEYPYQFLQVLYNEKERLKSEAKPELSHVPKIMMNGFYGKTIQINPSLTISEKQLPDGKLKDMIILKNEKNQDKIHYIYENFRAGAIFNPVVANEITANTRVQLFNAIMNHQDDIIGVQTDSIITDRKIRLDTGNEMGQWNLEAQGPLIMLGSGVYSIPGQKMRMRGFQRGIDLMAMLNDRMDNETDNHTNINVPITRNVKLKQIFTSIFKSENARYDHFNLIIDDIKTININFDKKRKWDRDFTSPYDVLHSQISSSPLKI